MKRVQSPSNALVKKIHRLSRAARSRRRERLVLLEGRKLLEAAHDSRVEIETVVVSAALSEQDRATLPRTTAPVVEVDDALFRRLSSLHSPEGVVAVAVRPRRRIEDLPVDGAVFVSVGVNDPRNLGAIARVAEAAGVAALVVVKGSVDPFGPKALRGSMGSLLRLPVFELESASVLSELPHRFASLVPRGGVDYRAFDWTPPVAILLGNESEGLQGELGAVASSKVTIPMKGCVESLNVATAAALVAFEAIRPAK